MLARSLVFQPKQLTPGSQVGIFPMHAHGSESNHHSNNHSNEYNDAYTDPKNSSGMLRWLVDSGIILRTRAVPVTVIDNAPYDNGKDSNHGSWPVFSNQSQRKKRRGRYVNTTSYLVPWNPSDIAGDTDGSRLSAQDELSVYPLALLEERRCKSNSMVIILLNR